MKDYLVRAISKPGNVRGMACVTRHLVDKARRQHGTYPTATDALGRALTAGALMGALLKNDQRVALKFEGNGPLKKILVESDSNGKVRGYVGVPDVELPPKQGKFDVAAALGRAGFLTVMKDLRLKDLYKGVVQLYTSEIAEDVAFYLTESEQIPSAVGLGVFIEPDGTVSAAGGFLIQSLPPADEEITEKLIQQIEKIPSITEFLRNGNPPEELLKLLLKDIPFESLGTQELSFQCTCSKNRMEKALISLGVEEIAAIIEKEEQTEVVCEFCRTRYLFSREELERLLGTIQ